MKWIDNLFLSTNDVKVITVINFRDIEFNYGTKWHINLAPNTKKD